MISLFSSSSRGRGRESRVTEEDESGDPQKVKTTMGHIDKEMPSRPGRLSQIMNFFFRLIKIF